MFVLIGCPVYDRAWVLPDWFEAIVQQDFPLEDVGFIFETAPNDIETFTALIDFRDKHSEIRCFEIYENGSEIHKAHPEGMRSWPKERYTTMSNLRNSLLDKVKAINPDRYFSLDSDILLEDPRTISELCQLTSLPAIDAISPLAFMTMEGTDFPNAMTWGPPGQMARRKRSGYPIGTLFKSDIIMAAVMMKPKVFHNAKYSWHSQGEDLGWSEDCKKLGYGLYVASYIYSAHVMSRAALAKYKLDGDPRSEYVNRCREEAFNGQAHA